MQLDRCKRVWVSRMVIGWINLLCRYGKERGKGVFTVRIPSPAVGSTCFEVYGEYAICAKRND